jgi:hypothetical protein
MGEAMAVHDLLADPARFDRQVVAVVGWFVWEREHSALYPSPAAARSPASGVWLVHPATVAGERETAAMSGGWVRAVGVFGNRRGAGCGHFNGWPAQLSGLSELRRIEPPSEASPAERDAAPDRGGR